MMKTCATCVLMESDLFAIRLTESYQIVLSRKIKGQHHGQKRVFVDPLVATHSILISLEWTHSSRSWIRLLAEVDKLKRQMSANVSALPINVECLIDERDFSAKMKRSDMEELCAPLFERVEKTLRRCLAESGLKQEDISEIELIGGSTRIPAVKSLIEQVFGKPPSTTLNQDECVARGAAARKRTLLTIAVLQPTITGRPKKQRSWN
ncbi:heat shock protein 110-like isoform X2 [Daphnia magna]|uniref:heat shock protein 110-like isoform X2 n=1 Tax=Daphnia magna TaxID=35525 RepID=UPI001E1BB1D0|nr:heat shock protein 110-like isoform X2 [Daphnia magna]